jgi:deoxyribonuclease V
VSIAGSIEGWPTTVAEARLVQEQLRGRVVTTGTMAGPRRIAGIDAHYAPALGLAWAAVTVLDGTSLELVESAMAAVPLGFPYVPGFLSFRETPAALKALGLLRERPDLLMVDGHGYAHPRRLGLATHIGLLADIPTVGVAKSRLVGTHDEPGPARGSAVPLHHQGERIGTVLRSRDGVRPLYVSVGHRLDLASAVSLVLATLRRHRLPEPTRVADLLSRAHPS